MNTLGHPVCAIGIYIFWWHKPLDVEQPISIKGKDAEQLLAFFWMTTDGLPVAYRGENKCVAEMRYLSICSDGDNQPPIGQMWNKPSPDKTAKSGRYLNRPSASEQLSNILIMNQSPWRSRFAKSKARDVEMRLPPTKLSKGKKLASTSIRNEHEDIVLEQEDVWRWKLAEDLLTEDSLRRSDNDWQATITDRSQNWPSIDIDPKNIDWSLFLAFNVSGIMYGGLHVLAWNAKFATCLQKLLWQFASMIVITFVPASTVVVLAEKLMFTLVKAKTVGHKPTEGFYVLLYHFKIWLIFFILALLAYLWDRVYLVVECFISLFHSPVEVYNLPKWSAYVPHIT